MVYTSEWKACDTKIKHVKHLTYTRKLGVKMVVNYIHQRAHATKCQAKRPMLVKNADLFSDKVQQSGSTWHSVQTAEMFALYEAVSVSCLESGSTAWFILLTLLHTYYMQLQVSGSRVTLSHIQTALGLWTTLPPTDHNPSPQNCLIRLNKQSVLPCCDVLVQLHRPLRDAVKSMSLSKLCCSDG